MDLREAIYSRRSTREFTGQAVDEAALCRLIDASVQAPSAVNEQPWSFCVVRDQALLNRISERAKAFMLDAHEKDLSPHMRSMLQDPAFQIFYHAPALIVISSRSPGPWTVENCALAAQNLMLAARGEGLGTCWIGFAQGWLQTADGKDLLGLPPEYVPVAPIIVGRPKAALPPVARQKPAIRWLG